MNNEYHSRFDKAHYMNCQQCYNDRIDFMLECEMDARLDELSELELNNERVDNE